MKSFDPQWRSPTVLELCQAMRQTQQFDALPVLADALLEAGCTDGGLVASLQGPLSPVEAVTLVARVYSDESRAAVDEIDKIAATIGSPEHYDEGPTGDPITYDDLIENAGMCYDDPFHYVHMGTNENYTDVNWERFWELYLQVTGRGEPPAARDGSPRTWRFFSCSC